MGEGYAYVNHKEIFKFNVDRSGKAEQTLNYELNSIKFFALEKN